jgi:hypothetical protein
MKLIKLFVFTLSLFFVVQPAFAQDDKPQKVHSIIYIRKDFDWYVKQYDLWKKELEKNKKNPDAWMNVITAARMAKMTSPDDEKREHWTQTEKESLNGFEKYISGTYEFWVLKRWQAFISWEEIDNPDQLKERRNEIQKYCLNAYEIDPDRPDVYGSMMNFYVEENNQAKITEIANRWLASKNITYSLYALNYNMLASCSENAIVFTAGDNDTYPTWILQNAKNFRKDVTVINIWLAHNNREYRNTIFAKANIPVMNENPKSKNIIIDHVVENLGDKQLFFAPNFDVSSYDSLAEKVFNVGAALAYSEHDLNNTSLLVYNFENNYLLDQLKYGIQYEEWPEKAKETNFVYVSGLYSILEHYTITQQQSKKEGTKGMILNIVAGTQYEEEIKKSLEDY